MSGFIKTRLGVMMFVQYVIWGSWYVTLNTYLTSTLHFSGTEAGVAFGTVSVACLVSPFFVGLVADRFFATERVMAALYALGAVFMIVLSRATTFPSVYALLLAFCLCYFPTIALSNSIAMQQVARSPIAPSLFPRHPCHGPIRLRIWQTPAAFAGCVTGVGDARTGAPREERAGR